MQWDAIQRPYGNRIRPARISATLLYNTNTSNLHTGKWRSPEQAHAYVRISQERRPHLGSKETGRQTASPAIFRRMKEIITWKEDTCVWQPGSRDVASRAAKKRCDAGYGVGSSKQAVYLDYAVAIERYGKLRQESKAKKMYRPKRLLLWGKMW